MYVKDRSDSQKGIMRCFWCMGEFDMSKLTFYPIGTLLAFCSECSDDKEAEKFREDLTKKFANHINN